MGVIYAARSVALSTWGADVGLSKHIYKIGYGDVPLKKQIAADWAGEHDWALVAQQAVEGLDEDEIIARVARMLMTRALAGAAERVEIKLKPADFGAFLIHNAVR